MSLDKKECDDLNGIFKRFNEMIADLDKRLQVIEADDSPEPMEWMRQDIMKPTSE